MKKKLEEKKLEILLQIIEEEIDIASEHLLLEYDDYNSDYYGPGVDTSDTGKGGLRRFWRDRGQLPGLLLSPVSDVASAFKKFGAKMGVAIGSFIGTTIAGAIQAILPFNDPRAVKYVGEKFRFWEDKSMRWIDKQFKTETDQMRAGWETFKNDFWGIGFIASPLNAIAAATAAAKGIDVAISAGNVITGGKLGGLIDKITADVEDPGKLESYLEKGKQEKEEETRKTREKRIEQSLDYERCVKQLDDPNWIDPECLGFAERNRFPAGPEGQQQFIDFVAGRASKINTLRNNRYRIEFGKKPSNDFYKNLDDQQIINLLKRNGLISESYIHEANKKESNNGIKELLSKAMNQGESSNAAVAINKMKEKFGEEATNEFLKKLAKALVEDPTAIAVAQAWTNANLPKVAAETFGSLNKELILGKVPNVTSNQIRDYQSKAGDLAVKAVKDTASSKGIIIPNESLKMIKDVVQADTNKSFASVQKTSAQPTEVPAALVSKAPAAPKKG